MIFKKFNGKLKAAGSLVPGPQIRVGVLWHELGSVQFGFVQDWPEAVLVVSVKSKKSNV